jgi:D-aminopeptidase
VELEKYGSNKMMCKTCAFARVQYNSTGMSSLASVAICDVILTTYGIVHSRAGVGSYGDPCSHVSGDAHLRGHSRHAPVVDTNELTEAHSQVIHPLESRL